MAMEGTISAENLVKVYDGKIRAVDDVSFEVKAGEVFGFLGPNGAGKTTTVSMLSAGLRPTSGRAVIDGLEVGKDPEEVKRRIGVIFQETTADGDLTGLENLEIAAGCYGIPAVEARTRAKVLIDQMQLTEAADRYAKTYSGGMRTATGTGRGPGPQPARPVPGRAYARPRPPGPGRLLGVHSEAQEGQWDDRVRHDALPR